MQLFAEFVRENKMDIPILCGGAAINSDYINRIAKGDGKVYEPGVFYCKTAFEGLKVMNNLMGENKNKFMNEWIQKLTSWKERKYAASESNANVEEFTSKVKPVKDKPIPPKLDFVTDTKRMIYH
jgi:5-methyltetrahydrofolate--homocysteine methyltransferase